MTEAEAMLVVSYARNNMSIAAVAKELFYHRNTVSYNFDKIAIKMGLDPRNFFDLGELYTIAIAVLDDDY